MGMQEILNEVGIMDKVQGVWKLAILVIIIGIFAYFYLQHQKKKQYTIDVGVHKKVGDGTVYFNTTAKQVVDEKGVAIFQSADGQIDLPALDSRYFVLSGKGAGRRYIDLFNPLPSVYLPYEKQNVLIFDRTYQLTDASKCVFCDYVKECRTEKKLIDFMSKEFRDKIKSYSLNKLIKNNPVDICNKHLSQYYEAKFKVVSEVSKEWLFSRMHTRLLRAITKKAWYDKPVVLAGIMIVGGLAFVFLLLKFGPQWFDKAMQESAKNAAESYVEIVKSSSYNLTPPDIK